MNFLFPIVFVSGVLTVLSPCVLPILPIILGSGLDGNKKRIYGIIIGLIFSFTFFALTLSSLVASLGISADSLRIAAALILGFFGLTLLIPSIWERIQGRLETLMPSPNANKRPGFSGGLITGAILGFVWTPCVGPIIATVTTLAAVQSFSLQLALLMLTYAIGIAIPLFLIAMGGAKVSEKMGWYKKNQTKVRQIFGAIILTTALLIGSGGERQFQTWVLDNLPESISNPVGQFEDSFGIDTSTVKEATQGSSAPPQSLKNSTPPTSEIIAKEQVNQVSLAWDSESAKIPLHEIDSGCPGKDCIPSIDDPAFESTSQANEWMNPNDRVFILTHNHITKIYPQRIMNWHEIVNDWFADEAIAVTYCPLCGSAVAFNRQVDGNITQFGVSGKLHQNDLVMYDRLEGSLWQQITGEAIVGPAVLRNEELTLLLLTVSDWQMTMTKHPAAHVLSRDTGYTRDYDLFPYGSYESNNQIGVRPQQVDERFHPKAWVYGVRVGETAVAFMEDELIEAGKMTYKENGLDLTLVVEDDTVSIVDNTTGQEVIPLRLFWFAWAAFNPDTLIAS